MRCKHVLLLTALAVSCAPVAGWADQLGDLAKPLTVREWVRGEPLDVTDGKHIYVIQFCSLGRASEIGLTNLSGIQQRFRDKGVLSVAVSDEPPEDLKEFVKVNEKKLDYNVAADDMRQTCTTYLQAYKEMRLPHVFVVGKDKKVLWHGHPLRGLDQALEQITEGRYDIAQAIKNNTAAKQLEEYLGLTRQKDPLAVKAGRMLLAFRTNNLAQLCELAFVIAADAQTEKPDFALAAEALDQAEKLARTNNFSVLLNRAILLSQTGKQRDGLDRARQALGCARTPDEKTDAQNCIRTIQTRLAAADTNRVGSSPSQTPR